MTMPMSTRRFSVLCATAWLVTTTACNGSRKSASAIDPGSLTFVASFYSWFATPQSAGGGDLTFIRVLEQREAALDAPLLAALREDRAATARSPGELVGLEFEPFTANQDPCDAYALGDASIVADRIRVPVFSVCNGQRLDAPSVIAEVAMRERAWVFTNILYPDGDDLLSLLRRQAEERARR
jgi:hypothetical protein